MKISVFILVALLLVAAIIYFIPFDEGVAESEDAATPFLPTFICFPKNQFDGKFKNIKNKVRNLGGRLYPIPGDNVCFEIVPETYREIKKWGYDLEILG